MPPQTTKRSTVPLRRGALWLDLASGTFCLAGLRQRFVLEKNDRAGEHGQPSHYLIAAGEVEQDNYRPRAEAEVRR